MDSMEVRPRASAVLAFLVGQADSLLRGILAYRGLDPA